MSIRDFCFAIGLSLLVSQAVQAQEFVISDHKEQIWFQYFAQAQVSKKWGIWLDAGIRTEDHFTRGVSTILGRVGAIYSVSKSVRVMGGYAFFNQYPAYDVQGVAQPEHRFWQMVQYQTNQGRSQFTHNIRLEERFRQKLLTPEELDDAFRFNYRFRYSFSWQYPLRKPHLTKGDLSVILLDEIMFNFGKQVVYDHLDQNRFMAGLRYYFSRDNNLMVSYLHIFQKTPAPQLVRISNNIRVSYFQTLHL